jgi:hypothetical protein
MNLLLIAIGILVAALLGLLVWSGGKKSATSRPPPRQKKDFSLSCRHLANLPQIRQALEPSDISYIRTRSNLEIAKTLRRERHGVASHYLESLREDFDQLMDAAQVVAALSPEVEARHEWKRFRLNLEFRCKYRLVRMRLLMGSPAFTGLSNLALLVSALALDLDRAASKIGETAALRPNL